MVLDSFNEYSPEVAKLAQRVLDDGHIDAEIRPGKRGGAFCASVLPEMTPWVLANYTQEPRQVATLAHELGHAIHAMLATDHSVFTYHSALPMAETASVFSEMLLTDRLLAEETDPDVRRDLLAEAIDDSYATILRQAYFVIFERDAHQMIAEKAKLKPMPPHRTNRSSRRGLAAETAVCFASSVMSPPRFYQAAWLCLHLGRRRCLLHLRNILVR